MKNLLVIVFTLLLSSNLMAAGSDSSSGSSSDKESLYEDAVKLVKRAGKLEKKDKFEEQNLQTVILLDPKNEQAMYFLIDLELERSNFSRAKELKEDFILICVNMCDRMESIDNRLKAFEKTES